MTQNGGVSTFSKIHVASLNRRICRYCHFFNPQRLETMISMEKVRENLKKSWMKGKGKGVYSPKLGLPQLFLSWSFFLSRWTLWINAFSLRSFLLFFSSFCTFFNGCQPLSSRVHYFHQGSQKARGPLQARPGPTG